MFGEVTGLVAEVIDEEVVVSFQLESGEFVSAAEISGILSRLTAIIIQNEIVRQVQEYSLQLAPTRIRRKPCHCGDDCMPGKCINTPG